MKTTTNIGIRTYLTFGCFSIAFFGFSQTQTFTSSGTFTVPAGVTSVTAETWGGGGRGSSITNSLSIISGGGGGGGAYTRKVITVVSGNSYTVTVGTGSSTTSPGGDSWFINNTTILAKGGNSAADNSATKGTGGVAGTTGDVNYSGGDGCNGGLILFNSGGGGSSAGTASNGNSATNINGATAPSGGGNGGDGKSIAGDGFNGVSPGGGGGGGNKLAVGTDKIGGAGANGKVIITWVVPQEINIQGNATTIADGDMTPTTTDWTDFGSVDANSGTITKTFTIQNTGGTTLTIGAISFSGANAADFTVTTNPSATVAAGANTTFVVTFNPSAAGVRTATISIVNDDSNENPYDYAIQGTGTEQEINIQGNATTIADGDSSPTTVDWTDFGSLDPSSGTIIKTFTIQNTGSSTLTIGTISISGTNASDFSVTTTPSATVAAGSSTTFVVTFNPSTIGTKTATLSIVNNDNDENPYDFAILGTGIQTFFDSDGDGIYDNIDVDDDNDGVLDVTEETNCNNSNGYKVNYKYLNETFGTGTRTTINTTYAATTTYCYQDATTPSICEGSPNSTDLNDGKYTVGPSAQIASWAPSFWYMGSDHTTGDTDGRMALFNASYTVGIFYTAYITGALPNLPITYSFWVLNLDRTDASGIATRIRPNIKVEFRDINDVILQTISTGDIAPTSVSNANGDWYQFTANLTLNVNAFKVIFINNNTGGLGNDLALDDILITQTLCDYDNDGIADVFDLDADNDGIEDVIEAGLANMSNGKGKIDVAWVDSNGNGLHDDAESTAALPALNSDGDGQPNYIDLDSDNDSLFDVDESGAGNTNAATGFVNGDGDITGDGRGDGSESETFRSKDTDGNGTNELYGDGILDSYDYGTGANQYGNLNQGIANANPATTYLNDADSDGIPDYLDVTSNGSTFDIANNLLIYDYKTLDANNNGIIDGTTDIDHDGILDTFDTNTAYFGSPRDLNTKLFLDFDGRNDYGQSIAILGGLSNVSLMAWIDLNPAFSTDGIIVGQDKFQIRITSAKKLEAVVNGTTITYNTALNLSQWYNVGATYDGSNLKLYLNGVLVGTQAASGTIAADASLLTIGKDPSTNTKYFKGKIDEVRVFNVALTDLYLQRMVYQEIKDFSSEVRGKIVPKNIATSPSSLPFANLLRYYRMDVYKDDIIDDLTTPATDLTGTKIYNHKNIYVQQAPMPFLTERTGDFATAVNNSTKEIRGLDIMDLDWSIVKVQHDITETSNNIDLGMIIDSGKTVVMNNDTKLQNDWYLKLDGKIDLEGKSQLLQTTESDLDVTSSGFLERDQQGQANLYNYNYWCSPVNPINITANNTNYTIAGILKDGTTSTPQNINWIGGYDGAPTSPISLARYWLYTFDNYANIYANWSQILETTPIRVGQGFTLKGSGTASGTQNLTFTGKPNNGLITSNTVGDDQILLTGNPYPSALDADAFITDNVNSNTIDGTLYFWEHYATNNTHILREYQGGYAVRNLTGGTAVPTSSDVDFISQLGSPSRGIPNQFIPVGQGFFVNGKIGSGGTVTFKNSQRGFHKEDEAGVSNIMYRTTVSPKTQKNTKINNNDPIVTDTYMKIRLGFISNNSYHRQVLLGFMNEKATNAIDYGYDALNLNEFPNDMYFVNGENQLVIQGVGSFDTNASFPIGVKTDVEGKVSFKVDALENFDPEQALFIYDNVTDTYNDVRNGLFEVTLPIGVNNNRFSLRFKDKTLKVEQNSISDIEISHIQNKKTLLINNKLLDVTVQKVTLFNILGQSISTWKIENQEQQNIQIPIKSMSSGVYIAKLKTSEGELSKKIIVFDD